MESYQPARKRGASELTDTEEGDPTSKQTRVDDYASDTSSSGDSDRPGPSSYSESSGTHLQETIITSLRTCKELAALGEHELELLCVSCYMKQNILPEQFLYKFMGEHVDTKSILTNLKDCKLLQQQEEGKSWTITSIMQEKIRQHILKSGDNHEKGEFDILEKALEVLILELNNRKEGHLPYCSYTQDVIVSGMEIWENVFQHKDLVEKYSESLEDFAISSYEEMHTPGISILFCTKAIRQLCKLFGQNDAKALSMKMCMTSIQARSGKSEQALAEIDEYVQIMENSEDVQVRALLFKVLEKKAYILKNEEKNCDEALNICDKILSLDRVQYRIDNISILQTKLFKGKVLNSVGQCSEALDICEEILTETKDDTSTQAFVLNVKFVMVEIFLSIEKNGLALNKVEEIINKRTELYGAKHSSVLEARTQRADILEEMTKLDEALEELNCILKINEEKYGANHVNSMHTKSNIARVLACKGQLVEASKLLNNMLDTITIKYGPKSREMTQFLEFKGHILRVNTVTHSSQRSSNSIFSLTHQLSFQESLNIYGELKRYYIERYNLSNFDSAEVIDNIVLHHYREGNWSAALTDAQWIFNKIRDELGDNHQGLEHPLSIMSTAYHHLDDAAQELSCLEKLYRVRMLNYGELNFETLNTLTRVAKLQIEMKKYANALISYETIYKVSIPAYGENHEKSINSLYKVAKLQLKLLLYQDALQNFERVSSLIRKESFENFDEIKLKTKYKIALCHLKLSNVEEARTLSKELYDEACWTFGEENYQYLSLYEFCQSVYERQKKSWRKYGKHFPRYKLGKYF